MGERQTNSRYSEANISNTRRWQRFLVWFASNIARRLQRMPRTQVMRFAYGLGIFVYAVTRYSPIRSAHRSRRYALRNLRLTQFPSPQTTDAEREAFVRRVFIHFSKSLVDFLWSPVLTPETLDQLVHAEGFPYAEAAKAAGKGTIFITAHMGNWEMLGRWLAAHDIPLTVVAREPEEPTFADYVRGIRENAGFSVVYRGSSARELLSLLRANKAIGLLPDQNSGDIFLPFFGIPAGTVVGPATLALHTGAALIPSYCVREPDDTYRLLILPPIDTRSTGDKDADVHRITTEVNQVLEGVIRQYPDQWLWLHNRWKSAFDSGNLDRSWPEGVHPELWNRWLEGEKVRIS